MPTPDCFARNRLLAALLLGATVAGGGWISPAAEARADERATERQARSASPLPAAGNRLPASRAAAAPARVVDFGALAREQARLPAPVGPPVGISMPDVQGEDGAEGEESVEPDAPAPRVLHVSTVESPAVASPVSSKSFAGLDDIPIVGTTSIVIPPDTDGAVGLTRILEGLNNNYRILDKSTGAVVSTISIRTFWSATGFTNVFDPKTLYDPYNDRWILCVLANPQAINSSILVAVSQTGDPAGAYSMTAFDADVSDADWADFPTVGFNKSWVAINVNMISISGGSSAGPKCLVLDYPAMRAGTFSGQFFGGTGAVSSPCATYSTTEPTLYVPTHLSSPSGTFRVDRITGTPAAPAYAIGGTLSRGLTWVQATGQILPQSAPVGGTSACGATPCKLESQDANLRSTPVFRGGSIYYTQTVGLPASGTTHTAVQWTRIDAATGALQDGGRIEDPTATATNGGKWYAYPHVAVNSCGDLVVGYSQFSSSQHPSAGYSYRAGADAPGTLRDPEIYKPGEDYYHKTFAGSRNRWGDYAKAQVDPSDDFSLWVLNEYAKLRVGTDDGNTGSNSSRWGTWWAKIGPVVALGGGPVLAEGNSGTKAFQFEVVSSMSACVPMTVNYSVNPGTATLADNDYQTPGSSIMIPAAGTSGTITVDVVGDSKREGDETFGVTITSVSFGDVGGGTTSATITNDDPVPTISLADGSMAEGSSGASPLALGATLSNPTDQTVTVSYGTQDNTATVADNDYAAATGTASFPAGTLGTSINVTVNGDTHCEAQETLLVTLSSPSGATIADGSGVGTITNDDDCAAPVATVVAPNAEEWHYFGDALDLRWTATDDIAVTSVDLRLSRDGGSSYEDIALGEANDGLYTWTVTPPSTDQALLRVIARDAVGNSAADVSDATWHIADVVDVPVAASITQFSLGPIRPNPARSEVGIEFELPRTAFVEIEILDVQGRVVATLVDFEVPAGRHQVKWRPEDALGSGLFFARARLGGKVLRERFVVTR